MMLSYELLSIFKKLYPLLSSSVLLDLWDAAVVEAKAKWLPVDEVVMKIYTDPLGPGEHKVKDRWSPNGYVTLTEEEYAQWVAADKPQFYEGAGTAYELADLKKAVTKSKDTPLGLPAPEEDWDEPELTPPDGQPLNCYHCGQVTRTLRWGMPICASCDKLCRRDHANRRA